MVICSRWMSSTVPIRRPDSEARARQSGKGSEWKGAMRVTCVGEGICLYFVCVYMFVVGCCCDGVVYIYFNQ